MNKECMWLLQKIIHLSVQSPSCPATWKSGLHLLRVTHFCRQWQQAVVQFFGNLQSELCWNCWLSQEVHVVCLIWAAATAALLMPTLSKSPGQWYSTAMLGILMVTNKFCRLKKKMKKILKLPSDKLAINVLLVAHVHILCRLSAGLLERNWC